MNEEKSPRAPWWPYPAIVILLGAFLYANLEWLKMVRYPFGAFHLMWSYGYSRALGEGGFPALMKSWGDADYYPPLNVTIWAIIHRIIGPYRESVPIANTLIDLPGILAMVALARRATGSAAAGVIAAALFLFSPFVAFYSRVPLYEAPMGSMLVIVLWGLIASENLEKRVPAVIAAIAFSAGMLMKWTFMIYAAGPAAFVAVDTVLVGMRRKKEGAGPVVSARQILIVAAAAGIVLLLAGPWYVFGLSWKDIAATAPADSTPGNALVHILWYPLLMWRKVLAPPFALALLFCLPALLVHGNRRATAAIFTTIVASWVLLTLVPHKDQRYAVVIVPVCALAVSVGAQRASAGFGGKWTALALAAGLGLIAFGVINVYTLSFHERMVPLDSGDLVQAEGDCMGDIEKVWTRLAPLLDGMTKNEIVLGIHPFTPHSVSFSQDVLQYHLEQRNALGKAHAFVIGYENHHYKDMPARYRESDIFLTTQSVWDMSREDVAKAIADMTNYLDPGGAPPPVPESDYLHRDLIESAYRLVDTVPLACGSPVLIYVRK
jgi:hypothetical protein